MLRNILFCENYELFSLKKKSINANQENTLTLE